MNRADFALVSQQMNDLSNTMMRARAMDQENQYRKAELGFREMAQQAAVNRWHAAESHYEQMEKAQAESAARREQIEGGRQNLLQGQQDFQNKSEILKNAMTLNMSGQLPDEARNHLNTWLKSDPHYGAGGIQLGKPDPEAMKSGQQSLPADAQLIKLAEDYEKQAMDTDDEAKGTAAMKNAEALRAVVAKHGGAMGEPAPARQTTYTYDPKNQGKLLSTQTGPVAPGTPALGADGSAPAAGGPTPAPASQSQRQQGRQYLLPNGKVGTWTGAAWNLQAPAAPVGGLPPNLPWAYSDPSAPRLQVPGVGSAEDNGAD